MANRSSTVSARFDGACVSTVMAQSRNMSFASRVNFSPSASLRIIYPEAARGQGSACSAVADGVRPGVRWRVLARHALGWGVAWRIAAAGIVAAGAAPAQYLGAGVTHGLLEERGTAAPDPGRDGDVRAQR